MSSFSTGIRIFVFAALLAASFSSATMGADPKITRASHETAAKEIPKEIDRFQDGELTYSPQLPEAPNTGAMLMRLGVGTVVVLALCVVSLWFGKPWLRRLKVAGTGTASFYVEGSVSVGNRAMLYLVRVGDTQLVAGTDAGGLKSLIALPQSFKDVLAEQMPEIEPAPAPAPAPLPFDIRAVRRPDPKE